MPGPAPTPTSELKLRGSRLAKRRSVEPQIDAGIPKCPKRIGKIARKEWKRVTAILMDRQIVTPIDGDALHIYCETFVTWQEANEKVRELGTVIKAPSGYPIQNPYLSIANSAAAMCAKMLEQFGMTPASRTRVQKTPDKKSETVMVRDRFMKLAQ